MFSFLPLNRKVNKCNNCNEINIIEAICCKKCGEILPTAKPDGKCKYCQKKVADKNQFYCSEECKIKYNDFFEFEDINEKYKKNKSYSINARKNQKITSIMITLSNLFFKPQPSKTIPTNDTSAINQENSQIETSTINQKYSLKELSNFLFISLTIFISVYLFFCLSAKSPLLNDGKQSKENWLNEVNSIKEKIKVAELVRANAFIEYKKMQSNKSYDLTQIALQSKYMSSTKEEQKLLIKAGTEEYIAKFKKIITEIKDINSTIDILKLELKFAQQELEKTKFNTNQ